MFKWFKERWPLPDVKPIPIPEPVPEPEEERLYIPAEHIEKVLELWDAYQAAPLCARCVPRYRAWRKIYVSLDLPMNTDIKYNFNRESATRPYIVAIPEGK